MDIKLELLNSSWLEHQKSAKDMGLIYPIDHPKRKLIEAEINKIVIQIQKLK